MPSSPIYRRDYDHDALGIALATEDMSLADGHHLYNLDDPAHFVPADSSHMIFDFDDPNHFERTKSPLTRSWDPMNDFSMPPMCFPGSPDSAASHSDLHTSPYMAPSLGHFSPDLMPGSELPSSPDYSDANLYSRWLVDPDSPTQMFSSSMPIPIPSHQQPQSPAGESFVAYSNSSSVFPDVTAFSPMTAFAALQPLPRSFSPTEDTIMTDVLHADAQPHFAPPAPTWATQLWDSPSPEATGTLSPSQMSSDFLPLSEDAFATQRPRMSARRSVASVTQLFHPSSAPSPSLTRPPFSRGYSRRAESISEHDDRDATVRRKKRAPADEDDAAAAEQAPETPPLRSVLRPPKLAPSAWQLYFTDWIQRHQASSSKKLNVAQAAKEAGQEYAKLSPEEKEPYKRRSNAAKEARERDLAAYMKTLTPDDIKRENAYRTAQRKAGKSRKGNIKDPNAPKKPLSAYFMFLQRIRSDPDLVREVFGDETETTKQSVLAAGKWRSMTDEERKPFLAQAEQEKLEYEAARKLYEEGTTGYSSSFSSSINFSILPSSPINALAFPVTRIKHEMPSSESDSEGFGTDDGERH